MTVCMVVFAVMGTASIAASCLVAYVGQRDRAHQGMIEGIGCWIVAALFAVAMRLPA